MDDKVTPNEFRRDLWKISGFIGGLLVAAQIGSTVIRMQLEPKPIVNGTDPEVVKQMVTIMREESNNEGKLLQLVTDLKAAVESNEVNINANKIFNEQEIAKLDAIIKKLDETGEMGRELHDLRLKQHPQ